MRGQVIKLSCGFSVALLGAALVMVQSQVVIALTPREVNGIAKQITVRIDGANPGSGVIIKRQGNTYTVLTNWHVLKENGNTVQTPDGRRYTVNQSLVKPFRGLDLAEFQFTSTENYRKSELGNSQQLSEGIAVYATGWANPDGICLQRCYRFSLGSISVISPSSKDGYAMVYTNIIKPGMSGGPVLDEQGRLIGINGQSKQEPITGSIDYLGIPINTYLNYTSEKVFQQSQVAVSSGGAKFFCGMNEGMLATLVRTSQGNIPMIRWISGNDSEKTARCKDVSARFQRTYENGTLNYLRTGTIKGQPVICAAASKEDISPCTDSTVLFILKPGTNPQQILDKLEVQRTRAYDPQLKL
ncbi:hypothetical protein DP113_14465 [Brasilonema octagenarum UFV-E1]|uniref:Serine protease n=2 Tax=Brasilonema TaxID=383614 RepID=A0A856ME62_9CYAN|nr:MULTISPECIES: COP23 domain-containing protein [Brasilonema]NMF65713.1 hypothetical protein [Brasilonema octagenarum UFV-OR1]QDL08952.1 hypothetical protein DP114_14535 [Brasilonema sennae CENA114]QDL15307.1 hypothetical protein DP113_14465 [Brasilonema octagenarum UFV-E1]